MMRIIFWSILYVLCKTATEFCSQQLQFARERKLAKQRKRVEKLLSKKKKLTETEQKELDSLLKQHKNDVIIAK